MKNIKISAGLVIIHKSRILLVKPNGIIKCKQFSIPKGELESGESFLDTAIRETKEETGLDIPPALIDINSLNVINYINRGKTTKKLYYYFADISNLEIVEILPCQQLQETEVEYAAFFTKSEAKELVFWRQTVILNQF